MCGESLPIGRSMPYTSGDSQFTRCLAKNNFVARGKPKDFITPAARNGEKVAPSWTGESNRTRFRCNCVRYAQYNKLIEYRFAGRPRHKNVSQGKNVRCCFSWSNLTRHIIFCLHVRQGYRRFGRSRSKEGLNMFSCFLRLNHMCDIST